MSNKIMKLSIGQTVFLIMFILLLPSKNILLAGSQPITKQKAWTNFKPYIATKETKRALKLSEIDSTVKKYYDNCKARADREFPGKFEIYEISKTNGTVSVDTQYIATIKSVFLAPRVNGTIMETHTDEQFNLPLHDELTFMDADLKVLWKKTFNWGNKAQWGMILDKITNKGDKIIVSLPDTSVGAMKIYDGYSHIQIIYNNKGEEIFNRRFGGETAHPEFTNNGKYLSFGEPLEQPGKKHIWKIFDLDTKDSIVLSITVGKEGAPHILDDGRIWISSQNKLKWFVFDSLKVKKKGE